MNEKDYEIVLNRVIAYIDGRLYQFNGVGEEFPVDKAVSTTLRDIKRFLEDSMIERNFKEEKIQWQRRDTIG